MATIGRSDGESRFEWAEGGFFLLHHVDIVVFGKSIKGIEVIGHFQQMGEEAQPGDQIALLPLPRRVTLDYVHELRGNQITIWFGEKGSSNFFKGKISEDGNTMTGAWQWPGGGYSVTGTRVA